MAVVTEPPYLQRDAGCVAAAFCASCCIRHTELSNPHSNDTRDDLRTAPVFTLCISLEEVQVLNHLRLLQWNSTFSLLVENFIEFFTVARVYDEKEGNT